MQRLAAREPAVTVHVRIRPMLEADVTSQSGRYRQCIGTPDSKTVTVSTPFDPVKEFTVHRVHDMDASDEEVYDALGRPAVTSMLNGDEAQSLRTCAVVTYGQTNTGKTHTWNAMLRKSSVDVFTHLDTGTDVVAVSCLQLHNDQVADLLPTRTRVADTPAPRKGDVNEAPQLPNLAIREVQSGLSGAARFYVDKQRLHRVASPDELHALLEVVSQNRSVAMTHMNTESSRSHVLFTLHILPLAAWREGMAVADAYNHRKLCFVDLAGSERVGRTKVTGARLAEAQFINGSLSALGNVVHALAEPTVSAQPSSRQNHIPFRDSKLTKLLQDYLGQPHSRCFVTLTLSPSAADAGESISVLKFGERATCIPHRSRQPSRNTSRRSSPATSRQTSRHSSPAASRGQSPCVTRGRSTSPATRRSGTMHAMTNAQHLQALRPLEERLQALEVEAATAATELAASREREEGLLTLIDALERERDTEKEERAAAEARAVDAVEQVVTVTARADKIQRDVARVEAKIAEKDVLLAEAEDRHAALERDNAFLRGEIDSLSGQRDDLHGEVVQLRAGLAEERASKDELLSALREEAAAIPVREASVVSAAGAAPTPVKPTATPHSVALFLRAEIERRTKHIDRMQERVTKLQEDSKLAQQRAHGDLARALESQRAAERRAEEAERRADQLATTLDAQRTSAKEAASALEVTKRELDATQRSRREPATVELSAQQSQLAAMRRALSNNTPPATSSFSAQSGPAAVSRPADGGRFSSFLSQPLSGPAAAPAGSSFSDPASNMLRNLRQDTTDAGSRFAKPDGCQPLVRGAFGVVDTTASMQENL